jgi:ribosomal protein L32
MATRRQQGIRAAAAEIAKCKRCGKPRWRHDLRCAAVDYISCPKGFAARKGKH